MPVFLKQSTAVDVALGPFLDSTDGVTAETGLTISQADVRLKKNNGAWAQVNDATAASHEENGWYEKELDATDTNTCGRLLIAVHESGALPVWHEFWVLEENVYDAIFAASAALGTDLASILTDTGTTLQGELDGIQADTEDIQTRLPAALVSGRIDASVGAMAANVVTASAVADGAIDAGAIASDAITAAKIATGAITNAKFAAGAIDAAAIADGAIDATTFAVNTGLRPLQTGTCQNNASASEVTIAAGSEATGFFDGCWIYITGGSGAGQVRLLSAFNGLGRNATVTPDWVDQPDNTSTYAILPSGSVDLGTIQGTEQTANDNGADINAILTDTNELQTDWVNGGRLDLLLDSIISKIDVVDGNVDDIETLLALTDADVEAILEDTGTTLPALLAALDALIDAIKAKTDSLAFTVANKVDANTQVINGATLTGNGTSGTPWGPA